MITDTTVPRIMRKVVFAITYILFQVLYNQLTNFSLIVDSTRDIKRCVYSHIFMYSQCLIDYDGNISLHSTIPETN